MSAQLIGSPATANGVQSAATTPPDPNGGGRMSSRTYRMGVALIAAVVFALTYALDRNRAVPQPPVPRATDQNGQAAANWPHPSSESVANPLVSQPAAAPTPPSVNAFTKQTSQPIARPPGPLAEWRARSYLSALQAPITVSSAHAGDTLELPRSGSVPLATQTGVAAPGYNGAAAQYHPPAPPYTLMAGTVLPAVLITGIDSDAPAQVLAQVAQNVYDTASGRYLLIPQGSRVIGDYSMGARAGQQRVVISWNRLVLPDTASIDLPSVPATDAAGYGGLADQVDNHYLKQFGTAAVISLIDAGQMVGQMGMSGASYGFGMPYGAYGGGMSSTEMMGMMGGQAASQQLGQVTQNAVQQGMSIPPTLSIRPGYLFNIEVTTDVTLPGPYPR
jgi:type IV secretory pathway VirB10-like protein